MGCTLLGAQSALLESSKRVLLVIASPVAQAGIKTSQDKRNVMTSARGMFWRTLRQFNVLKDMRSQAS
jgi:hypothetical protein